MTRIKTVYPSDMVCHLWANRHPLNVRTPTENIYTSGKALYSYGSHYIIGAFLDDPAPGGEALILWNTAGYSKTTAKHTSQAFRALSSYQRQRLVRCHGGLNRDNVETRNLGQVAQANINHAIDNLEKAIGARSNRDDYVRQAREALEDARKIYRYTGDKKSADSVLALPETMDKAAIIDTVSAVKKTEYLREAAKYLASAKTKSEFIVMSAERYAAWRESGKPAIQYGAPTVRAIMGEANGALGEVEKAAKYYKLAKANPSPTLTRIRKTANDALTKWAPEYKAENAAIACARILKSARQHLAYIAAMRHNEKHAGREVYLGRYGIDREGYMTNRRGLDPVSTVSHEDAVLAWPDSVQRAANLAIIDRAVKRGDSIRAYGELEAAIDAALRHCEALETNFINGTQPNVGTRPNEGAIVTALAAVGDAAPSYWKDKAQHAMARTRAVLAAVNYKVAQRNAEAIERWKNGERVSVPYDVPVMARVVGDVVETSRNARVPLDHAARLVKIAQRIAARGGMAYAAGTGPRVGHFQVNFIGADMRAVIGCHEFSAEETARIVPIIEREATARGIEVVAEFANN